MNLMERFLERLEMEGIPSYSMTEEELKRAVEILRELIENTN